MVPKWKIVVSTILAIIGALSLIVATGFLLACFQPSAWSAKLAGLITTVVFVILGWFLLSSAGRLNPPSDVTERSPNRVSRVSR